MSHAEGEVGEVLALNHDGDGIVKTGKTAFVPGVLPGETVRFVRGRKHRKFDEAKLEAVIVAAADRVEPPCPHFGICGGCALQHLRPEAQLAAKQAELADGLERIARVTPGRWLEPLRGEPWNYRRRARLSARYVRKKGRSLVGFRERSAPYVAQIDTCRILVPPFDTLVTPLGELLSGLSIREQVPQVELSAGDSVLSVVVRVLADPTPADLEALRAFGKAHGLNLYLQRGGLHTVTPLDGVAEPLEYTLPEFGVSIRFEPWDFIQVNAAVNRAMVSQAIGLLGAGEGDRVLDLFCGLGNFSLPLARGAGEVVGVEGDEGLVLRARENATRNGITNAQFHVANLAAEELEVHRWWTGGFSHVLIDPPRAGAREVLPHIVKLAPRRIVYVSCHPGTLARDLAELVHEHGYALEAVGVIDMFPHTTHVESMAVLSAAAA